MKPFQYMKLNVKFRGLEGEVYPYFLGSFIRGNFGMYLKKTVCPFHFSKSCEDCLIHKKCFYAEIFEARMETTDFGQNIPLPFVIDLVNPGETEAVHSDLEFGILLFGPALNNFEFFILVFSEMGKSGIGKRRIKCKQVLVEDHDGQVIYSSGKEKILASPRLLNFEPQAKGFTDRLQVCYRSPVRLKREGKIVQEPDFEVLVRAALRRYVYLEQLYGTPADLPFSEIIEESTRVRTVASDIHWEDRVRYSNRRRHKMNLGGLLGRQEFAGSISPSHLNLLGFASIFHLGKTSTFGHGKIEVRANGS
jgi:hypothetical protein